MMSSSSMFPKLSKEYPLSNSDMVQVKFQSLTISEKTASDEKFIPSLETNPDKEYILKEQADFIAAIKETVYEANAIIKEVHEKSDQIKNEAHELGEKIRQEAFEEGFNQGLSQGKKQFIDKTEDTERLLIQTINLFETAREQLIEESMDTLIDLLFLVAKKVIHKEISLDRSIIERNIHTAMAMILRSNTIKIRLHPDDISYIKSHKTAAQAILKNNSIQLLEDTTIQLGGCFIETDYGNINATIEGQLEELKKEFADENEP
ncbi:MAG: FliH/SctL family protein [bacterium]